MQRTRGLVSTVLIGVVLAALLAGCVPASPTPAPVPTPTEKATAGIEKECLAKAEKGRAQQGWGDPKTRERSPYAGLMYAEGQVLVLGAGDSIDQLIRNVISKSGVSLVPYGKEFPDIPAGDEVIRQYKIEASGDPPPVRASVEFVTCLINAYADQQKVKVSADPNYAVTPAGWHGGGSPWTQNGVWAQPGGGLGTSDIKGFLNQWAFDEKSGIALFDGSGKRSTPAQGKGVVIGVFDTSPLTENEVPKSLFASVFGESLTGQESGQGQLHVHDAQPQNMPDCPGRDRTMPRLVRETYDLSSHGLFVASLAHAVAPQSDIYLVRVLEDDACGDLATILRGLDWFQTQMTQQAGQPLDKTVVNLSLGLNRPDAAVAESLGLPSDPVVRTLQAKIQDMINQGVTVVAAAGNDSFDQPGAGEAEIPARDEGVIGVAASTAGGVRGCFSNAGKIAAPGGDGVGPDLLPSDKRVDAEGMPLCDVPGQIPAAAGQPPVPSDPWVCERDGTACVVGLVWRNGKPAFSYWVGTSFATPMVSGLAALAIETQPAALTVPQMITRGVTAVDDGESLGAGIINVDNTIPD